eukprot:gene8154-9026_t
MSCPSPDSSTQPPERKRLRKSGDKRKSSKRKKEKSLVKNKPDDVNAVQNDVVNSTQDVYENRIEAGADDRERLNLKRKHSELKRKIKEYIVVLKDYERDNVNPENLANIKEEFQLFLGPENIIGIKPLDECIDNRTLLCKQLFKIINKKKFKKMLPRNLKKYNTKEVKQWCIAEVNRMSDRNLKAAMNGEDTEISSSEDKQVEENEEENTSLKECDATGDDYSGSNLEPKATLKENVVSNEDMGSNEDEYSDNDIALSISAEEDYAQDEETESSPVANDLPGQFEMERTSAAFKDEVDKHASQSEELSFSFQEQHAVDGGVLKGSRDEKQDAESKKDLTVLELELRAKVLKSFIKAKEKMDA